MKTLLVVMVAALSVCLSGCASIVSSSNKTLPIMTQPDDATCEIIDMATGNTISRAKTPQNAILSASAGFFQRAKYNIKLSKDGYIPYETQLDAGINGWYFGNIVFGGILGILIIDPATGAMWKINDDNINVKLYPNTPEGRVSMANEKYNGNEAYKKGDYDQAILDTTRGLTIHPDFYEGYCVRAASYAAKGEFDKATEDINKALSISPQDPKAYNERGDIYVKLGKTDEAFEDFNKAIALNPDYAEALFNRGYLYSSQMKKEQAKDDIALACKRGFQRACNFQF